MAVNEYKNMEQDQTILTAAERLEKLLGGDEAAPAAPKGKTPSAKSVEMSEGERVAVEEAVEETAPGEGATESDQTPEGESESADEEARKGAEGETFEVTLTDGTTASVTADELIKGYSREADYTRKTQRLAEERRTLEAQTAEAGTQWQQKFADVDRYFTYLVENDPVLAEAMKTDMVKLAKEEPGEYTRIKAELEENGRRYQAWMQQKEQWTAARLNERLPQERELLIQKIPDAADPAKWKPEVEAIMGYLTAEGLKSEEVSGMAWDHRLLVIARKAMLYDRLSKARVETAKKLTTAAIPKIQKPGTRNVSAKSTEAERLDANLKRLKKSGSTEDAAAIFFDMLR